MKSNPGSVLGLFPYFGPDAIGGVQASAKIAWSAVTEHAEDFATLVSYVGANGTSGSKRNLRESHHDPATLVVDSKTKAIYTALARRWPHNLVFVWHMGLLRLLPFFRLSEVRVVLMLLGVEAWKEQSWFTTKQLEKVDLFLSISNHTWDNFVRLNRQYEDKPHQTVLLGIEAPLQTSSSTPANRPAALMLSRLSKGEDYKGHREVITAWPRVLQRIPEAELWIAGDGDLRNDIEQLVAELGLGEKVRFLGQVTDETKQELLLQCRCLVMPSRGEGFGLVYLEAMRVGRPCLVSTLDAGQEVVNPPEAGLAADPDNAKEVADCICRLLASGPEWERWSRQARIRYEANYTARHFQDRLLMAVFPDRAMGSTEQSIAISRSPHV
jgi:glycosyltransferase involved in cell wall biosynthesis